MLIVGLTGGYASGKSTVSGILSTMGAVIIDADKIARNVVKPGTDAWKEILEYFGKDIILADGELDRKKLGEMIFEDQGKREILNSIVHPKVMKEELRLIENISAIRPDALVILEVPLLFESGHHKLCSKVIVVYTDNETHLRRLMERDGFSREEAIRRISTQMPLEEKNKMADYIVDNSGTFEDTRRQTEEIFKKLVLYGGVF